MDKALRYLALAAKAGKLIVGAEDCAKTIKRNRGNLLVLASDAGGNTASQAENMAQNGAGILCRARYTKEEIAQAIGRGNPVALVMICDEGLAKAFAAVADKD